MPALKRVTVYALMILLLAGACHGQQQKRCVQITLLFTDTSASDAEKKETAAVIRQRFENEKTEADIAVDNEKIIAKIGCTVTRDVRKLFLRQKFAIYETYTGKELHAYFPTVRQEGPWPDFSLVNNAMLYTGKPADLENLRLWFYPDSSKMALPGDVAFFPGMIKKDKPAVEIYAVKMPGDYRPVTIGMIKEISAKRSSDGRGYDIVIAFKEEYQRFWADMVMRNQGRALAVMSDNMVLVCPVVNAPIENGAAIISHMMPG